MSIGIIIACMLLIPSCTFFILFAWEMHREQDTSLVWIIVPAIFEFFCMILMHYQLNDITWIQSIKPVFIVFGGLLTVGGGLATYKYEMDLGHKKGLIGIGMACIGTLVLAFGA